GESIGERNLFARRRRLCPRRPLNLLGAPSRKEPVRTEFSQFHEKFASSGLMVAEHKVSFNAELELSPSACILSLVALLFIARVLQWHLISALPFIITRTLTPFGPKSWADRRLVLDSFGPSRTRVSRVSGVTAILVSS